jgi:hypothetical protein
MGMAPDPPLCQPPRHVPSPDSVQIPLIMSQPTTARPAFCHAPELLKHALTAPSRIGPAMSGRM